MDIQASIPFLTWLARWEASLKPLPLAEAVPDPGRAALLSVDLIVGFAYEGPLSGPRVAGIVPPTVRLFRKAYGAGVRRFILLQDCHPPDALEFGSFGAHCICGTREAETVPELLDLPFGDQFVIMPKNSLSSSLHTPLDAWLNAHHQTVDTFIVVSDCTDLCVYQLAMYLRLRANAHGYKQRVIVPADCVQTYNMPVDMAETLGTLPHDGDLMHAIFLYQMALNGVQVATSIA